MKNRKKAFTLITVLLAVLAVVILIIRLSVDNKNTEIEKGTETVNTPSPMTEVNSFADSVIETAALPDTDPVELKPSVRITSWEDFGYYYRIYFTVSPIDMDVFESAFNTTKTDGPFYIFKFAISNDSRIEEVFDYEMKNLEVPFDYYANEALPDIHISDEEEIEPIQVVDESGTVPFETDSYFLWGGYLESYDEENQRISLFTEVNKNAFDAGKPVYVSLALLDSESIAMPLEDVLAGKIDPEVWIKEHLPVYLKTYGTDTLIIS